MGCALGAGAFVSGWPLAAAVDGGSALALGGADVADETGTATSLGGCALISADGDGPSLRGSASELAGAARFNRLGERGALVTARGAADVCSAVTATGSDGDDGTGTAEPLLSGASSALRSSVDAADGKSRRAEARTTTSVKPAAIAAAATAAHITTRRVCCCSAFRAFESSWSISARVTGERGSAALSASAVVGASELGTTTVAESEIAFLSRSGAFAPDSVRAWA